jgi:uncharacterized protein involved in exopolysaccharide biosynthesis
MSIQELVVYWKVITKRLWLIGLLMAVTLGAMIVISYLSKPMYTATISFQVSAPLPSEVTVFSEYRESSSRDEIIYTRRSFLAVLQSAFVHWQAIEELGLDMDADELAECMVIDVGENTEFFDLDVTLADPELAAAVANTLVDKTALYIGELSAGSITTNKEFIQEQLREVAVELEAAREALLQFQIENRTGSPSTFLGSPESLLTNLRLRRDQALAEGEDAVAASYDEIIAERERGLQELILVNSEYATLQAKVNRIGETYARLLDKETEAELKENEILSAKFVRVIPARAPTHPLPRLKTSILFLGAVMSLALGIALAFLLEYLSNVTVDSGISQGAPRESITAPGQGEQEEALGPARQSPAGL